jgi:hypothetical protein
MSILSVAVMDSRDEAGFVGIAKLHFVYRNRSLSRRGALRRFEDESSSMFDSHLLRVSGHRIFYRLERDTKIIAQARGALKTVNIHIEWNKLRFEQSAESSC